MDKEIIRQSLDSMRRHFEKSGLFKPIRKEPAPAEILTEVKKPDTLKEIEQNSFSREEFKESDLGF